MKKISTFVTAFFCLCVMLIPLTSPAQSVTTSQGIALFGELKYKSDFKNFNYVNPDAPKGGTYYQAIGEFDNFNPYATLGGFPPAIFGPLNETLMVGCTDEPNSVYGLIAESVKYPSDYKWIEFKIRSIARWHDGKPITVEDVMFTYKTLLTAAPTFKAWFEELESCEITGKDTIRFTYKRGDINLIYKIAAGMPVFSKSYWEGKVFDQKTLEPPLMSGPYKITKLDIGNSIVQERVKDYWGKDLPVNKGRYNFDTIVSEVYRTADIQYEAFMAGNSDYRFETDMAKWEKGYSNDAVKKKMIVKAEYSPKGAQMVLHIALNLRREVFKNVKVREAMTYAYDFDWINNTMYYGKRKRIYSYFSNTDLAHTGKPVGKELQILNKFKSKLDPRIFQGPWVPPSTGGTTEGARKNLKIAANLLKEAGWTQKGGKLVNSKGEQMKLEFLGADPSQETEFGPFIENLKRLGIDAKLNILDTNSFWSEYWQFKWDMVLNGLFPHSLSPGTEFRTYWGSEAAKQTRSFNFCAVQNPVIDALIEEVVNAKTRNDKVAACRALDRVLLYFNHAIPTYYFNTAMIARWDRFGMPAKLPEYTRTPGVDSFWIDAKKNEVVGKFRGKK
jgi:microcin C transport system substrate-binding protein